MRASIFRALALGVLLAAGSASADAPAPPGRRVAPRTGRLVLFSVDVAERGRGADRAASELRRELRSRQSRLDACVGDVEMREDPLRVRSRTVSGTVAFTAVRRPSNVRVSHAGGAPAGARRCVAELMRSVQLHTPPRGRVVLRFRYEVRL